MPDVFISYAREDQPFVRRLYDELKRRGQEPWVDWQDIAPSARWWEEVGAAIEGSDTFVFVMSPSSAVSDVCRDEVDRAAQHSKRIVPIVYRDVDGLPLPQPVAERNWIFLRASDSFSQGIEALLAAMATDLDWVKLHTRLLVRALEWDAHGREKSFLLRGQDLDEAEQWLIGPHPLAEPERTPLQAEYILSSRRAATRTQRFRIGALGLALVVTSLLAVFAFVQRGEARRQTQEALRQTVRAEHEASVATSRALAASSFLQLTSDPELGLVLAIEAAETSPTREAENALRAALDESLVRVTFHGHTGAVYRAELSPDGTRLLTVGADGTARIWDAATGVQLVAFLPQQGPVRAGAFSPNGRLVVSGGDGNTAWIWDATTGAPVVHLVGHTGRVYGADFSPDGGQVVTASLDRTVRIWDATTGAQLHVLLGHEGRVYAAHFTPDGRQIVSASADTTARLWDVATGDQVRVLVGPFSNATREVDDVAVSPDGKLAAVADDFGHVTLVDLRSGNISFSLQANTAIINGVEFSPDGTRVITASNDGTARIWDLVADDTASDAQPRVLRGHRGQVWSADFDPDPERDLVVTAGADGTARLWDVSADQVLTFSGHTKYVNQASFSPDGDRVVTASDDRTARIWDAHTGEELLRLEGHTGSVLGAAFSPDGTRVVTASTDDTARVWDARTGSELLQLLGHDNWVRQASFSPDGDRIVTASYDRTARIWDAHTGEQLLRLEGHTDWVLAAAFSPDGTRVVTASVDGTARVWDATDGSQLLVLQGHSDIVRCARFSPDGSLIVTAGDDRTARIWDATSGQTLRTLIGHTEAVFGCAFVGDDGEYVATASVDRTVRYWATATGDQMETLRGYRWEASSVDPNGDQVVTGGGDWTARIFECDLCVPLDQLLELARTRNPRDLTPAERAQFLP